MNKNRILTALIVIIIGAVIRTFFVPLGKNSFLIYTGIGLIGMILGIIKLKTNKNKNHEKENQNERCNQ